ncbi:hypothetical protein DYGSA30_36800 [Dyella sp. GSA-30]|nr:hypothetical protein DYGSA30_36800 [Dyella sp. GSA-30]
MVAHRMIVRIFPRVYVFRITPAFVTQIEGAIGFLMASSGESRANNEVKEANQSCFWVGSWGVMA